MMGVLKVEPVASKDFGPCPCCGDMSRSVWGYVHGMYDPCAAYFVHWTLGQLPKHGAHIDFIIGDWGDGTSAADRSAVSLEYRITDNGPGVIVIDAHGRDHADGTLAKRVLGRDDVLGKPVAKDVFTLCDAILALDDRLAELPWGER
jgi:hypothetical protein